MTEWAHIVDARNGRVSWAFPVSEGMRPKDMPKDARPAIDQRSDSLPDVVFRDGAFYSVKWKSALGWPEPEYTKIQAGDWLAEVDGRLQPVQAESVVKITSNIKLMERA